MRRTKEDAEITRKTILDAALKVFSSKGYSATRLEDIADIAGVTRGAIYWHFKNKADLYNTLVNEILSRIGDVADAASGEGGDILQRGRRMGIRTLQVVEQDSEMRAVMELISYKTELTAELAEGFRAKVEITRAIVEVIANELRQGKEQGLIHPDVDPVDAARAWLGLRDGLVQIWLLDPKAFSLVERAPMLVDIFMRGIAAPGKY